jgi:hypothetical protein
MQQQRRFTGFTSTNVQILTPTRPLHLPGVCAGDGGARDAAAYVSSYYYLYQVTAQAAAAQEMQQQLEALSY